MALHNTVHAAMICADEIRRPVIEGSYPLAAMQRNLLGNGPNTPVGTNIQQVIGVLRENVDSKLLEKAWQFVVDRHSILRTAVRHPANAAPVQEIHRDAKVPFALHDLRDLSRDEQAARFKAWLKEDRRKGFALDQPPLMRAALFQLGERNFRMVWTFHHLLLDASSFTLVLREVFGAYEIFQRGSSTEWNKPRPYFDFVEWLNKKDYSESEQFWRAELRGLETPTAPELPRPERTLCADDDSHGERAIQIVAAEVTQLKARAQDANVTLNTFIHAAWSLLLGFYSGKDDVLFGAIRAGRRSSIPGADAMVGLFINTVPVRIRIENTMTIRNWLGGIRKQQMAARPHEHTPLGKIAEWSGLSAGGILLPTVVNFQNQAWHDVLRAQGGAWLNREFEVINQPDCPLWLDSHVGDELVLKIGYSRSEFEDEAVDRLAAHLKNLLLVFAENLDRKVGEIQPFSDSERQQILVEWNRTEAAYWDGKCAHQLFELEADLKPGALAVAAADRKISYGDLNAQATELALRLQGAGIGPGMVVGVCFERSPELIVAILAVLKAGAAYAPLDPMYPSERLAYIVTDARIPLVLTVKKHFEHLRSVSAKIVCLDSVEVDLPDTTSKPPADVSPEGLAYVIYTSGSTGQPKGVAVEHRSLVNLITWHRRKYQVTPADRATLIASPAFDASVWELWPYLSAGASIHIPDETTRLSPNKLADWLCANRITLAFVPTPLAEADVRRALGFTDASRTSDGWRKIAPLPAAELSVRRLSITMGQPKAQS
jgi:non-ribosomal peptide synthetase component F